MKKPVPPCAACKTPGGYVRPGRTRPGRFDGAAHGIDGELCHLCNNRCYRRAVVTGARRVQPRPPAVICDREPVGAEREAIAGRMAIVRAEKIRRAQRGCLAGLEPHELDMLLSRRNLAS